jgi:subtilase family serine protease
MDSGTRGLRRAAAVTAAVAVLAGCGAVSRAAPAVAGCLTCYTPQQIRVAYGIQPLLDRGVTGRGQTVVLPEFPPEGTGAVTDIRPDLARFDGRFGLPAASVQVVNTLARVASPWLATPEEVADTEVVHAIAPGAAIREVLIPSSGTVIAGVVAALRVGLTQGAVISLSADAGEQCFSAADVAQLNSVLQAAERDRRDCVEHESRSLRWRLQPAVSPACLPGRHRGDQRRARCGGRR